MPAIGPQAASVAVRARTDYLPGEKLLPETQGNSQRNEHTESTKTAVEMSNAILPLSPVDHVFTGVGSHAIEFAFAYQGTIDPTGLQRSLGQTLKDFWPLRSQLARMSDHSYGLISAEDGLVFRTSQTSESFEEARDVSGFIDPVQSAEGEPLTRIKLSQTPRGSVLGVSVSHALVDGFSLFHFLTSWSKVHRGQRILRPSCERHLLRPEVSEPEEPVTPDEVLTRCGLFWAGKRRADPRDRVRDERLLVPKEAMGELLAEARQDCEVPLFHNDVLTAHLWRRCITQWEDGDGNPTTCVSCPVDIRRTLRAVPRTYFGNALCFATASVDYDRLASASLGELALLVRQAVGRVKEDTVWRSLRTLERLRLQHGLAVLEEIHVVPPQHGMLVTNISRLPMQGLDFGYGPPTAPRALSSSQRAAAILPAEDGVEIRVFHPAAPD